MMQRRCLNCGDFSPDDNDLSGAPLQKDVPSCSGLCRRTNQRMMDGWACGKWTQKINVK